MLPALLTTVLFALTGVFATQASLKFGGTLANFGRLLIATLVLGFWVYCFGENMEPRSLFLFMGAGAIGYGCGGWCLFQAFPRIGSTLGLLVVECMAAVFAAILGWSYLGASLDSQQIAFALMAMAGVVIGLAPFHLPEVPMMRLMAGTAFCVLAALAQGISWVISKHGMNGLAASGLAVDPMTVAFQRILGGCAIAIVTLMILRWRYPQRFGKVLRTVRARSYGWVIANAVSGPVLGISCMMWAIREAGNPGLVQSVVATATLVTVPFARRLEHRTLKLNYFIGAGVSIIGIAGLLMRPW